MKKHHWKWLTTAMISLSFSGVLAQADAVKQYSSQEVAWRLDATIDYAASPAEGTNLFMSVATDQESNIYVANYNNILIVDGETGERISTIVDETGTIQQYNDIAVIGDGTFWIADKRTAVYRVNADGTILSTVVFETSPSFDDVRNPGQIEVDPEGNLWVNYGGSGIFFQIFTPEGDYIRSIITGARNLQGANFFTFAPDGTLFFQGAGVGWITEKDGQAIVHELAPEFMAEQAFFMFYGIAIDADSNVYFGAGADMDSGGSIFELNNQGSLIGQFGHGQARANWASAFETDEIGHTASLALSADGNLVIAHQNNIRSQLIKLNIQDGN